MARTDFVILKQDLVTVLREVGLRAGDWDKEHEAANRQRYPTMPNFQSPPKADTDRNLLADFMSAVEFPTLGTGALLGKATPAIKAAAVASGTTDFAGKLTFNELAPGRYFVVGFSQTRGGYVLWNVAVELKVGANVITLDQRNASLAF